MNSTFHQVQPAEGNTPKRDVVKYRDDDILGDTVVYLFAPFVCILYYLCVSLMRILSKGA